jgi:hypothetical protein
MMSFCKDVNEKLEQAVQPEVTVLNIFEARGYRH